MAPRPKGVAGFAIAGLSWNYFGSAASMLCSLTIGTILARLLGPRPFGQAIIASMIAGFVNLFVDGGFSQALIQRPELGPLQIRRTFTCQVVIGIVTTLSVFLLAPVIASQFHDPTAVPVIRAMSALMTVQSLGLVSAALLRRSMRFKRIQQVSLASYLSGYLLVGLPLAISGAGVWSLVLAYLSQGLVSSVGLYLCARHSLLLSFELPDRSITSFGGVIVANNIVNWGHSNLDNLAASQLGATALGLYGRASTFAYQPCSAVVHSLQSLLLSSTARIQERKAVLQQLTLAAVGIVLGILGPAYVTLALNPATVIQGLYGDKWVALIPLMVPLALAMPFYGAHALLGPILAGLGRPSLEFWPQAISAAVAAVAYFVAARYSLILLSWAFFGIMVLRFGLIAVFAFRLLGTAWATMMPIMAGRAVFSLFFGLVVWAAELSLRLAVSSNGLRLIGLAIISVTLLCLTAWTLPHWVVGRQALRALSAYSSHFPAVLRRRLLASVDGPDARLGVAISTSPTA